MIMLAGHCAGSEMLSGTFVARARNREHTHFAKTYSSTRMWSTPFVATSDIDLVLAFDGEG